MGAPVAL